ncbi:MAG: DUF1573 domain-containing protein [Rhodospirillales bacterium]|nr:DUF1573 domain-containing protein [Rhodospirillales bacterium]MDH3790646.1 DUF1573 domain-containing protein [Rhodospirillales bacterium]MDH3914221.1 DUF1573 domain-containing protein [Rhodospirillales bacterium]MDH3919835.1 DUF1573 domain-containing protein [Rhodospirillales bacterium]MDH3969083.1 DUF1573 domain-containing protein [Rhodospirillales bacterium]
MARVAHRKSARSRAAGKDSFPIHWIIIAVLLLAGGGFFVWAETEPAAPVALEYAEEDMARDRPFRAIHEMRAGPPIPFLPADQPQPKIVVPSSYYDFGQIGAKAVVKRTFLVRNEGDAPLTISRAYTTCGCTVADFTARVIPPGKAALVTLILDAGFHDVRGQTVKRGIIIENNDRRKSKAEIWTRASVARS